MSYSSKILKNIYRIKFLKKNDFLKTKKCK